MCTAFKESQFISRVHYFNHIRPKKLTDLTLGFIANDFYMLYFHKMLNRIFEHIRKKLSNYNCNVQYSILARNCAGSPSFPIPCARLIFCRAFACTRMSAYSLLRLSRRAPTVPRPWILPPPGDALSCLPLQGWGETGLVEPPKQPTRLHPGEANWCVGVQLDFQFDFGFEFTLRTDAW